MKSTYLELVLALAGRQVHESSQTSFLRWFWLFLGPLLQLGIYIIVFGVLFQGRFNVVEGETPWDYALGVFLGMIFVQVVTEPLGTASGLVHHQAALVKKNVFPRFALPLARTAAQGVRLLCTLCLWAAALLFVAPERVGSLLFLPLLLPPLILIALGLNAGISALSVYLGDFGQVVQVLSQVVFWSSGVFYSRAAVEAFPAIWTFLQWNPVLHVIEESRHAMLWGTPVDYGYLGLSYGIALGVFLLGFATFRWLERGMTDFI